MKVSDRNVYNWPSVVPILVGWAVYFLAKFYGWAIDVKAYPLPSLERWALSADYADAISLVVAVHVLLFPAYLILGLRLSRSRGDLNTFTSKKISAYFVIWILWFFLAVLYGPNAPELHSPHNRELLKLISYSDYSLSAFIGVSVFFCACILSLVISVVLNRRERSND